MKAALAALALLAAAPAAAQDPSADLTTLPPVPTGHERFTRIGADALIYELTYSDPRVTWTRDEDYRFFEYACHEGNVSLRNHIAASRAERAAAGGAGRP